MTEEETEAEELNPRAKDGLSKKRNSRGRERRQEREREKAKGPETEWRRGGKVGMAQPGLSHAARA